MKNLSLNIILGLGLGTFFSTEAVYHPTLTVSDKAFASIPVMDVSPLRSPNTFAPSTNNQIVELKNQTFDKNLILNDYENKLSEEFKIPEELRERVAFWFDIYTKYSAQEEVIHHADYPWVVFRVVDLRPILEADGNRWVKHHQAVKFSKTQRQEVRNILTRLSKKKSFTKLKPEEQEIYEQLLKIPGKNRHRIIRQALASMRTQVGQKNFIEKGIESSSLYLPELEKVFTEKKLPLELTRLPFVESSFNVDAVSKVGASGVWQVMPYIGKRLDLVMNNAIDERNSPVKAAESAAFILKQNKQILKNWPLALTAYNHGAGSLTKAVKATGSRDLKYLIKNYNAKSFGFASQNFYTSFLAVLHAEKYKGLIYDNVSAQTPILFRELKLTKSMKLKKVIELTGLTADEFKKYNLDIKKDAYKKNMLIPKGYVVHIPHAAVGNILGKKQTFAKLLEEAPTTTSL